MQHIHLQGGFELRQRGFDLPTLARPRGEVDDPVDLWVKPCRDQGDLTGPEARRAGTVAHRSARYGLWQGRQAFPGEPRGTSLGFQPGHEWVIDAEGCEPAGSWHACDGSRPP